MANLQTIFETRKQQAKHKVIITGFISETLKDVYQFDSNLITLETWLRELPTFTINPLWKPDAKVKGLEDTMNRVTALGRSAGYLGALAGTDALDFAQFKIRNQIVSSLTWQGTADITLRIPFLFINDKKEKLFYKNHMRQLTALSLPTSFGSDKIEGLFPDSVENIQTAVNQFSKESSEEMLAASGNGGSVQGPPAPNAQETLTEKFFKNDFFLRAPLGIHYLQRNPFKEKGVEGTISIQIGTMFKATGLVCDGMEITHEQLDVEGKPMIVEGSMSLIFIRQPTYQEFIKFFLKETINTVSKATETINDRQSDQKPND